MRTLTILIFLLVFNSASFSQVTEGEQINLITIDINNFWNIYDLAKPEFKVSHFKEYLKNGTRGLQEFKSEIKNTKKLALSIRKNSAKYEAIRAASLRSKEDEQAKIDKGFNRLRALYPSTIYPDIYFVIGGMNVGSKTSENGIIIGYETMSVMGNESLLPHIMHEAIHVQQNYSADENRLLGKCISEGAANLISELVLEENKTFKHSNDEYAYANEKELWKQFEKDMKRNRLKNWLYDGKALGNGPKHIGYWIGYQIVKEYYLKSEDKKQAIREILNIKDFKVLLAESGYADKF
ncbi:DUF2268 domain-containing putative Zn-dependent protease [uncultured Croceitalea sp.]|uniref:gliding motility protein GldB-related protein n=1 Tax=uncultured Croceitalea sp. TaxID=1798908 RepID=UPI0033063970